MIYDTVWPIMYYGKGPRLGMMIQAPEKGPEMV